MHDMLLAFLAGVAVGSFLTMVGFALNIGGKDTWKQ